MKKKLLLATVLLLLSMMSTMAKVWYVGTWEGKPSEDVKNTLADAYAAASANDEIWIAEGEYIEPSIALNKSKVFVYGSFVGTETSINQRSKLSGGKPWEFQHPTVLTNSGAQVFVGSGANSIEVDGITFDGKKKGNSKALYLIVGTTSTSHIISNCIIKNYIASTDGGGMSLRCTGTVKNCLLTDNESTGSGGGIYLDYACRVENCEITNNKCQNSGGGIGANYADGNSPTICNCVITGNTANGSGGGIYGDRVIVYNILIANNTAASGGGMALRSRAANLHSTVYNVTIVNNHATSSDGGGLLFTGTDNINCNLYVYNGILWNNTNNTGINNVGVTVLVNRISQRMLQNCLLDGTDYTQVTLTDCIVASDSAAIFGNNYRLKAGSPAVDAGIVPPGVTLPAVDLAGNLRVNGEVVDLGAYELEPPAGDISVESVSISQTVAELMRLERLKLTATILPVDASVKTVIWSSENSAVATVDAEGMVKAIAAGTTNIIVTSTDGGKADTCTVTVQPGNVILYTGEAWGDRKTHNTVADAYADATGEDQIWIAEGEYVVPSITLSKSKVVMYGGFAGTENELSERAKVPGGKAWEFQHPTVLTNSGAQIFNGSGANSIVTDGITFDGKRVEFRRAMNLVTSNTTTSHRISNCIIKNYLMNGDGAGLNIRCKADIYDTQITGNENTGNGGGGAYFDYLVTMYRCEITNNKSGNNGGGVQANGLQGTIQIYNCRFDNNTALNNGGGVYGNQLLMHDCIIVDNTAGKGGGIALDARKTSSIWNVTLANNKATLPDGAGGVSFYENATHADAVNVNQNQHLINSILWNNKGVDNQISACANAAGSTANKTNGKILNCIIDKTTYSYLTVTNSVIAVDSAAIFGQDWVTLETAPTVDAGTLESGVTMPKTDYAGNIRIIGNSVDIGPYENQNGEPYVNPNQVIFDQMMEIIRNEKERDIDIEKLSTTVSGYVYNLSGVCNVAAGVSGFFPDIDYSDTQGNAYNWKATQHLDRLINMAYVYTMENSPKKGDIDLYNAIVAGINAWIQSHPAACSNWWYNQIAEPQRLGTLLIQMRIGTYTLQDEVEEPVLARMLNRSQSGYPGTGNATSSSNITNVAEHCIYSALLTYDEGRLTTMLNEFVYPTIKISTGITSDGIKPDQSHIMHDRVLYIGGYGEELIRNVTFFSVFTAGTKYAMPLERVSILGDFIRNTWQKTVRGRYMLWDVTGRGISRINELDKLGSAVYLERMKTIEPNYSGEYEAAIQRIRGEKPASYLLEPLSRQHFIADHTLHIRPEYTFDVNFVSTRTRRIEWGNGENKKALYMSDGCTNIVRRGDEYATIQGTWNWARVPGITCLQTPTQTTENPGSTTSVTGTSSFAGGVTDSLYSVTAYSYPNTRVNLSAKKGWFMFDDEIVCLGNSITAASGYDAYDANTTLNQCNLIGDVVVSENGSDALLLTSTGEHPYAVAPKWVLHDSIGYIFPEGGDIVLSNQTQSGNWNDINNNGTDSVVSRDVFSLWFNHGKQVVNGSYAYIIVPGKTAAEMQTYYATGTIEILANNDSVQAVHHKGLDIYGIIFYKAASFAHDTVAVKADKACALLLKMEDGQCKMNIADPAQLQGQINIGTRISKSASEWKNTVCDFRSTGDYQGASKAYVITFDVETGLKISNSQPGISIYPNPVKARQTFTVKTEPNFSNAVIGVYTFSGVKILEKKSDNRFIELSIEQPGIYFIRVKQTEGEHISKIIVW